MGGEKQADRNRVTMKEMLWHICFWLEWQLTEQIKHQGS